ncbi:hypothetical protein TUMSATVNIG1_54020 [Vibrio nigripulchritudo]|uniref:lamin tail domain-containing protein n=1 Tax=Vibrio nigripulchritudo TaxID=28173 RepID=UPI00190B6AC7|nr:lamin tail domain-containing protein [Vibrio nigripulchritudo]BCL73426.1 hypothetical protein VNTUMSATTG_53630 [Vibrio nigripulchritudo]BDU34793.1 hypothetical protein TUMSATVNIG1_54020 [Vibrio nigripulchritudo]
MTKTFLKISTLSLAVALAGCGGGEGSNNGQSGSTPPSSDPTKELNVTAIDGYLRNAKVWLDLNNNFAHDINEPLATTGTGGQATLNVENISSPFSYPVVVEAIKGTTIDEDSGAAVTRNFLLSAPPGDLIITPLTTLLKQKIDRGSSAEQAKQAVASELQIDASSVSKDYKSENLTDVAFAARVLVHQSLIPESQTVANARKQSADNAVQEKIAAIGQLIKSEKSKPSPSFDNKTVQITASNSTTTAVIQNDRDNDGYWDHTDAQGNLLSATNWNVNSHGAWPAGADLFPTDPNEYADSDGDKVGDNSDAFPNDASESKDSDGDGVGDNSDAFPSNPNEQKDSDGDGVGDNSDAFPNDPNRSTLPTLIINEVSTTRYISDQRWVEVYNSGSKDIDLSQYVLKSGAIRNQYNQLNKYSFPLPQIILKKGEYILLQAKAINNAYAEIGSSNQVITITENSYVPYWTDSGFVEIVQSSNNQTVDFVRFGLNTTSPTSGNNWAGTSTIERLPQVLGRSLSRPQNHTDTNKAEDWAVVTFATPGGVNDVNHCTSDTDNDNVPDCAERPNTTYAGMDMYGWGARENQPDIFIEIDYMDPTNGNRQAADEGIIPRKEALDKVKFAFQNRGYSLHFDTGSLHGQDHNLGGGNQVPFSPGISLSRSYNPVTLQSYKIEHMDIRRRLVFYYMMFGNSQNRTGASGSSGVAEINGNDSLITLGRWGLNSRSVLAKNTLINFQSGTIMHEFGHNLGLLHGGNENLNFKPNYYSVMNYMYQLNGLSTLGQVEGDRYYLRNYKRELANQNCRNTPQNYATSTSELINGPYGSPGNFKIDYSDGSGQPLDETNLDETRGLGRSVTDRVDFNCDGDSNDTAVSLDLTNVSATSQTYGKTSLTDFNDWGAVSLRFRDTYSGNTGAYRVTSQHSEQVTHDYLANDSQEYIVEAAPSAEFFERLKKLGVID